MTENQTAQSEYPDMYAPPIRAFITNLGKYNEGELIGKWHGFPTTKEEVQETLREIGVDGVRYEEFFISEYDTVIFSIYDRLGEYESLDEINYLAVKLDALFSHEIEKLEAVLQLESIGDIGDVINLLEDDNMGKYIFTSEIENDSDIGFHHAENGGYNIAGIGELANYINFDRLGSDIRHSEGGIFVTPRGYIKDNGESTSKVYDGSVPEEYRVFAFPEGIQSTEKSSVLKQISERKAQIPSVHIADKDHKSTAPDR
jgi:hypothetical protein